MTEKHNNPDPYYYEDEIDLLDLLIVLAKRKKLIIGITTLFALASIAYALLATPIYRADTSIMPPTSNKQSQMMSMMAQAGVPSFASGLATDALGIKTPGELVVGLVNSRNIQDRLIKRFDLVNRFEAENTEATRLTLSNITSANTDTKTGLVNISVMNEDPVFSSNLTNAYVNELQNFIQEIAISDVAQKRLFLEDQVKETHIKLLQAENDLMKYQEKTGIIDAKSQASAVMENVADLRATIASKEVELNTVKTFATGNNPKVRSLKAELEGLRDQLSQLQAKTESDPSYAVGLNELPDAGMEYLRKLRDQKFYETLYGMLLKQFEQAKMAEAQEPAIIQVIDEAVPPQIKTKPKRKQIVILATVLGFFLSIFLAFVMEFFAKASQDSERKEKLDKLRSHLSMKKGR